MDDNTLYELACQHLNSLRPFLSTSQHIRGDHRISFIIPQLIRRKLLRPHLPFACLLATVFPIVLLRTSVVSSPQRAA